jgi:hypothetical protein
MILPFGMLRINDRELRLLAYLETFEHSWEVRAKFENPDDFAYVAGLFATSSEAVALEIEVPQQDVMKHYRGEAKIAGIPTDPTEVIRFVGMGSHPERLDPIKGPLDE